MSNQTKALLSLLESVCVSVKGLWQEVVTLSKH